MKEVSKLKIGRSAIQKYAGYLSIGIITGLANGLFGSGGGTVVVPAMVLLWGVEDQKAHATAISIILPMTVISAYYYISNGFVDWGLTFKTVPGGAAGGYIGARLLDICPAGVLRKIFAAFMIFAALRMLIR